MPKTISVCSAHQKVKEGCLRCNVELPDDVDENDPEQWIPVVFPNATVAPKSKFD